MSSRVPGAFREELERFAAVLAREALEHPPQPTANPAHQRFADELLETGMVILPGFFDDNTVQELRTAVLPALGGLFTDAASLNLPPNGFHCLPSFGTYRLYDIDQHFRAQTTKWLTNELVIDVVAAYTGGVGRLNRTAAELRTVIADWQGLIYGNVGMAHCDHHWKEVKVFVFLEEIGPEHGPMCYWTKTHRPGRWRLESDFMRHHGIMIGNTGVYCGGLVAHLENSCTELAGMERRSLVGPAGTVVIADTRGLHMATPLHAGRRLWVYSNHRLSRHYDYTYPAVPI